MLVRQEEYLLAKRWREHDDRDAAHKLVTSHLRLVTKIARRAADLSGDLRGQCRPDAGGRALRTGEGLPVRYLCRVVDQGGDPGIHSAVVVAGEDGHHGQPRTPLRHSSFGMDRKVAL